MQHQNQKENSYPLKNVYLIVKETLKFHISDIVQVSFEEVFTKEQGLKVLKYVLEEEAQYAAKSEISQSELGLYLIELREKSLILAQGFGDIQLAPHILNFLLHGTLNPASNSEGNQDLMNTSNKNPEHKFADGLATQRDPTTS